MSLLPLDVLCVILRSLARDGEAATFYRFARCTFNSSEFRERADLIEQPLVFEIETKDPNEQFSIPIVGANTVSVVCDWGDGSPLKVLDSSEDSQPDRFVHCYDKPGRYMVRVHPRGPGEESENGGDRIWLECLAQDSPNSDNEDEDDNHDWVAPVVSFKTIGKLGITSLRNLFRGASDNFNPPSIVHWNVSNVKDMTGMFDGASAFDQPIGSWDVSNVKDMSFMFSGACAFNQPIGKWNVSHVTDMEGMFDGASAFNQPIGAWDVAKVTNTSSMFKDALAFNQPIGSWNVSKVLKMESMFENAKSFNQPIGLWQVGNVVECQGCFVVRTNSTNPSGLGT